MVQPIQIMFQTRSYKDQNIKTKTKKKPLVLNTVCCQNHVAVSLASKLRFHIQFWFSSGTVRFMFVCLFISPRTT